MARPNEAIARSEDLKLFSHNMIGAHAQDDRRRAHVSPVKADYK